TSRHYQDLSGQKQIRPSRIGEGRIRLNSWQTFTGRSRSERQTELALHEAGLVSSLRGDLAERRGRAIDGQARSGDLRGVQNVERVEPELQALRFTDLERFRKVCVKAPRGNAAEDVLTQVTLRARLRIHENVLGVGGVAVGIRGIDEGASGTLRNDSRDCL